LVQKSVGRVFRSRIIKYQNKNLGGGLRVYGISPCWQTRYLKGGKMKKARKAVRIALLVLLILVVVAVVAIALLAESILKSRIEAAASKTLGVEVSIGDVDLSLFQGKLGLENLVIKNPEGYQHDKLLELADGRIGVTLSSLLKDPVNIREIKLDGMEVVLEQRGISSNNLQDVIRSIPAKDKQREPSGKKLHIDSLEITNVTVKVKSLPIPGTVDTVPLKLKPIKMTNLGSDNKLDAARLSGKILLALAAGVAEQGAGVLPEEIIGPLSGELEKLGKLSVLLEEGRKILKEETDLVKELTEGLEGLLKPKKNKK